MSIMEAIGHGILSVVLFIIGLFLFLVGFAGWMSARLEIMLFGFIVGIGLMVASKKVGR